MSKTVEKMTQSSDELEKTDKSAKQSVLSGSGVSPSEKRTRRKRLPLSCGECRKKKLSCDRKLPCQRCVRSGRPGECSYDTEKKQSPASDHPTSQRETQPSDDEIRRLRAEVLQLKQQLSASSSPNQINQGQDVLPTSKDSKSHEASLTNVFASAQYPGSAASNDILQLRERTPRGYYTQHTVFRLFDEVPDLFPFVTETANEWLQPLGVHLKKDKTSEDRRIATKSLHEDLSLDSLLPPKDDTDALTLFYLDNFEQLHRVVHVPTFKREYATFWLPGYNRQPAITVLILSMISVSICAFLSSGRSAPTQFRYRTMPLKWVSACENWARKQGPKHRKLRYYQISCLIYLAKRMNMSEKKRFWKETGSLVQDAVMDGLHLDHAATNDTPYVTEMKRRLWHVIRELDLQNSYEHGMPTLLYSIDSSSTSPHNIDDEEFDEASKAIPAPQALNRYTFTSCQSVSSHSWSLRLEISRCLFGFGTMQGITYENVLRYTNELTQAIESLPSWDEDGTDCHDTRKVPSLARAFLQLQLKACIIVLHQPYLRQNSSKFWLSESISYQISRDILVLYSKLSGSSTWSLTQLRVDHMLAALNLACIISSQPKDSNNLIVASAASTIELLERCLPFAEGKYLYSARSEPWCLMTMWAVVMLLKVRLCGDSRQVAKSLCAQKFLEVNHKQKLNHQESLLSRAPISPDESVGLTDVSTECAPPIQLDNSIFPSSWWQDNYYSDFDADTFGLDMDFAGAWET